MATASYQPITTQPRRAASRCTRHPLIATTEWASEACAQRVGSERRPSSLTFQSKVRCPPACLGP